MQTPKKASTFKRILYNPYLDYIPMLIMLAVILCFIFAVRPRCNYFPPADPHISFPFAVAETVPSWLLYVLILPCTAVALIIVVLLTSSGNYLHEIHRVIFLLLQALVLQELFVEVFKKLTGRYRPDYFSRIARYAVNKTVPNINDWQALCLITDPEVLEGRMSFISGHSSSMFAAMTVLSYVTFIKIRAGNDSPYAVSLPFLRLTISILPQFAALFVAVSRFFDFRHHISDILAGGVVGVACALAVGRIHHRRIFKALYPKYPHYWTGVQQPYGSPAEVHTPRHLPAIQHMPAQQPMSFAGPSPNYQGPPIAQQPASFQSPPAQGPPIMQFPFHQGNPPQYAYADL